MPTSTALNWPNLILLILFLIVLAGIGFYLKSKVKTSEDFWVGGRQIGPVVTAVSYCAAYYSTVAIIGGPAMYYLYGMGYQAVEFLSNTLLTGIAIFIIMALRMRVVSERVGAVSLPGFLAARFESNAVRIISGILITVLMIPYGVAVLKGIGNAIEVIAGIPYIWGIIIVGVTALIYMVSSGYWGIAWTDMIQGIMIVIGAWVLAIVTLTATGGFEQIMVTAARDYPELLTIPGPIPWGIFFSYSLVWAIIAYGQPQLVTKFLGLKDTRTFSAVIITSIIWMALFFGAALIIGVGGRILFADQFLNNPDYVSPALAHTYGNLFVSSLFLFAAMAAGLTTLVALVLTSSAAITKDIYEDGIVGAKGVALDPKKSINLSRVITGMILLINIILALNPWDIVWQLSTAGAGTMAAAFTAPIMLGLYWKRATRAGCLAAMISGSLTTFLCYVFNLAEIIHPYVPGMVVSFIVFIVVSFFTPKLSQETLDIFFMRDYKKPQATV